MKKPNPKIFMLLMALSLLGGTGMAYVQYNQLQAVNENVRKLRAEAKEESEVQAELEAAKLKLEESSTKLSHLEQGVSELAYVPTLLKEIEKTGKDAGLTVLGVRPLPKVVKTPMKAASSSDENSTQRRKPYTELDVEIRARGDYKSVQALSRALQMFPKIVAARTVSMQPKQQTENMGAPQLEATFELRSYLFTGDKPAETKNAKGEKVIQISGRNKVVE